MAEQFLQIFMALGTRVVLMYLSTADEPTFWSYRLQGGDRLAALASLGGGRVPFRAPRSLTVKQH